MSKAAFAVVFASLSIECASIVCAQQVPATSEQIVVSATKLSEDVADLPASTTVITAAELRARGIESLSDALTLAAGVEAFDGSDDGFDLPNVSMWGVKEFDDYLVEVDGVPLGGSFTPDLRQIDIRSVDRIEIVRGPAGVVHGSTALAGVISIHTSQPQGTSGELTVGSFGARELWAATGGSGAVDWSVRGSASRFNGWRERTGGRRDQLEANFMLRDLAGGALRVRLFGVDAQQDFGSPLPVDEETGLLPEGIGIDDNLALPGSEIASRHHGITARYDRRLSAATNLVSVTGFTHRRQHLARSFVDEVEADEFEGAGTDFRPRYLDAFEDLRFEFAPTKHRLLAGISAAYGSLSSTGKRFDFEQEIGEREAIGDIAGTPISVTDHRLFAGVYAEDEWTPTPRLTATGGLRLDRDHEKRTFASDDEDENSQIERTDTALSGRAAIVYRLLPQPTGALNLANIHAAFNNTFKPATVDVAPQEDEGLLKPERAYSVEAGLKLAGDRRAWQLDLTAFEMHITNLEVAAEVADDPTRISAAEARYRGIELEGDWRATDTLRIRGSFAAHDPRYVDFEGFNGKIPELTARRIVSGGLIYSPAHSVGGSITVRSLGPRPLDRDNEAFTPSVTTIDASLFMPLGRTRIEVVGRNLTNKRFFTTDSELEDGLRYLSRPRSISARMSVSFF